MATPVLEHQAIPTAAGRMLVASSVEWASSLPQVLGHGQHKRPGPEESNKAHCRGEKLAQTRIAVRLLIASMSPRGVCCWADRRSRYEWTLQTRSSEGGERHLARRSHRRRRWRCALRMRCSTARTD